MKGFICYVTILVTFIFTYALLYMIADHLMIAFNLTRYRISSLTDMFRLYVALSIVELITCGLLVWLILLEAFYRNYRLKPLHYFLGTLVVFGLYGFVFWRDPYSYLSADHQIIRLKHIICHLILGVLYPIVVTFWSRNFKLYRYAEAD